MRGECARNNSADRTPPPPPQSSDVSHTPADQRSKDLCPERPRLLVEWLRGEGRDDDYWLGRPAAASADLELLFRPRRWNFYFSVRDLLRICRAVGNLVVMQYTPDKRLIPLEQGKSIKSRGGGRGGRIARGGAFWASTPRWALRPAGLDLVGPQIIYKASIRCSKITSEPGLRVWVYAPEAWRNIW